MNNKNNVFTNLVLGLVCLVISSLTLTGDMSDIIKFQSPLNELMFAGFSAMAGIIFLIAASLKDGALD